MVWPKFFCNINRALCGGAVAGLDAPGPNMCCMTTAGEDAGLNIASGRGGVGFDQNLGIG